MVLGVVEETTTTVEEDDGTTEATFKVLWPGVGGVWGQ
jgi:hypothetical protein